MERETDRRERQEEREREGKRNIRQTQRDRWEIEGKKE